VNCRKARKLVFEFIDGIVDDTKRLELEKHIGQCPACDKLASELTRSMDLIHRVPQEKTSDNFAWNLRMKINQERNASNTRSQSYSSMFRSWNLRYATTAVAAFAVVLVAGLITVDSGFMSRNPVQPIATDNSTDIADNTTRNLETGPPELIDPRSDLFRPIDIGPGGVSISPGESVIDAPSVMSPAQVDSLLGVEINSLTPEQKLRYMQILSQYLAQRYRTEMINYQKR
jgi:hypothetical protein